MLDQDETSIKLDRCRLCDHAYSELFREHGARVRVMVASEDNDLNACSPETL
jgi:hypothetical protein